MDYDDYDDDNDELSAIGHDLLAYITHGWDVWGGPQLPF